MTSVYLSGVVPPPSGKLLKSFLFLQKLTGNRSKSFKNAQKTEYVSQVSEVSPGCFLGFWPKQVKVVVIITKKRVSAHVDHIAHGLTDRSKHLSNADGMFILRTFRNTKVFISDTRYSFSLERRQVRIQRRQGDRRPIHA